MRLLLSVATLGLVTAACSSATSVGLVSDAGAITNDGAPSDPPTSDGGSDASPADSAPPTTYTHKTLAFDDLPASTTLTNQYATWATFSSSAGCSCQTTSSAGLAASTPYYLWTYSTCAGGSSAPFIVAFAAPVRAISFKLIGVNNSAKVATVRAIHEDGTTTTKDAIGQGNYSVPVVITLTDTNVIRLEIVDVNDSYGLGLDDLAFDFPD